MGTGGGVSVRLTRAGGFQSARVGAQPSSGTGDGDVSRRRSRCRVTAGSGIKRVKQERRRSVFSARLLVFVCWLLVWKGCLRRVIAGGRWVIGERVGM